MKQQLYVVRVCLVIYTYDLQNRYQQDGLAQNVFTKLMDDFFHGDKIQIASFSSCSMVSLGNSNFSPVEYF